MLRLGPAAGLESAAGNLKPPRRCRRERDGSDSDDHWHLDNLNAGLGSECDPSQNEAWAPVSPGSLRPAAGRRRASSRWTGIIIRVIRLGDAARLTRKVNLASTRMAPACPGNTASTVVRVGHGRRRSRSLAGQFTADGDLWSPRSDSMESESAAAAARLRGGLSYESQWLSQGHCD